MNSAKTEKDDEMTKTMYKKNKKMIDEGYDKERQFLSVLEQFKAYSIMVEGGEPTLDWAIAYFKNRIATVDAVRDL